MKNLAPHKKPIDNQTFSLSSPLGLALPTFAECPFNLLFRIPNSPPYRACRMIPISQTHPQNDNCSEARPQ
jgi:hypothetical protein